jgi:hypothetical protein
MMRADVPRAVRIGVGEFGHASSKRNVHRQAKFSKKLQTGYSTVSRSRLRTGLMAAMSD